MTSISSSYGIIMNRAFNAPGNGKNVVKTQCKLQLLFERGESSLINYQVMKHQGLELLPVIQKTSPINL